MWANAKKKLAAGGRVCRAARKKREFSDMVRDPAGERRIGEIAARCRAAGKKFEDQEFPADANMLFGDPANPAPYMRRIKKELDEGKIKWLRPDAMGNANEIPQVFADGIEPEDINQGEIGDCYFLAALAACSTREELIDDLIVEDWMADGIYGVKLYVMGEWKTVVVDDLVPCRMHLGEWTPIFCRWKGTKETWAMILEKAWAKQHGSYEAIEGGLTEDALNYLSGGCTTTTVFDAARRMPELHNGKTWESLLRAHKSNSRSMATFISASGVDEARAGRGGRDNPNEVGKKEGGLVSGHAYSVLDVREAEGHQLVQLRNPWGNFEWSGDWGDKSALWTPSLKSKVGFVDADDGSFWMCWRDFVANFGNVGTCKTVPTSWSSAACQGAWRAGALAGGRKIPLSAYNPTYLLTNASEEVWLSIQQPDVRGRAGDWVGMYVAVYAERLEREGDGQRGKHGRRLVDLTPHTEMAVGERTTTVELQLDPKEGPWVVVVAAFREGVEGSFRLSAHSPQQVSLAEHMPPPPTDLDLVHRMKGVPMSPNCATCLGPVDVHDHESRHNVRWHPTPQCFQCAGCRRPFSEDGEGAAGGDGGGLALSDVAVGAVSGAWGGYCFACWSREFAEKCIQCGEPLQRAEKGDASCLYMEGRGKFHLECEMALLNATADKCVHCHAPVVALAGRFSGLYMAIKEPPGSVHEECWEPFQRRRAPACIHCAEPICVIPGKFSGSYFEYDDGPLHGECRDAFDAKGGQDGKGGGGGCAQCGKRIAEGDGFSGRFYQTDDSRECHEECFEAFQVAQAKRCAQCGEPVFPIAGKFSGSFLEIDNGAGAVHGECLDAWRAASADPCKHCGQPIALVPGKFAGVYRNLADGTGKVHEECYNAWKAAAAPPCKHCGGPIMELEGRFSGKFFDMPNFGAVHKECVAEVSTNRPCSKPWRGLDG